MLDNDGLNGDVKGCLIEYLNFNALQALCGVSRKSNAFFSPHRNARAQGFLNAINLRDWARVEAMLYADASLRNCQGAVTDQKGVAHPSITPLQLIVSNCRNSDGVRHIILQLVGGMQVGAYQAQLAALATQGGEKIDKVAAGAAWGYLDYAEELRGHGANINMIAYGEALGNCRDYEN